MMGKTFFTADNHWNHANILKYCDRPFADVDEMDRTMIDRWNEVVGDDDTVYHLGDFTLGDARMFRSYISRLRGRIFILSNTQHHDKRWLRQWSSLDENLNYPMLGEWGVMQGLSRHPVWLLPPIHVVENLWPFHPPIVLCHFALEIWDRRHYNSWHLHGHSHGRLPARGLRMDVGVDAHDFRPVSLTEVAREMKKRGSEND